MGGTGPSVDHDEELRIAAANVRAAEDKAAESERKRAEAEQLRAEAEKQRADAEKSHAEEARLRAEAEKQRAEAEKQRAEAEKKRAEVEEARAQAEGRAATEAKERLVADLRAESERLAEAKAGLGRSESQRLEADKKIGDTRLAVANVVNTLGDPGTVAAESPPKDPTVAERQKLLFDIWAKAVDTQMHFNEMATRQRGLGLTFVVAALSLAVFLMTRGDAWAIKAQLDKEQITTTDGAVLYAALIFFTICVWAGFALEVNSVVGWLVRSGSPHTKKPEPDTSPAQTPRAHA